MSTDNQTDISSPEDRGEQPAVMEPLLLGYSSPHRPHLHDLAMELATASSGLRRSLPAGVVAPLADLVRAMNCYYSNLIEGHTTHPVDIERALAGDYEDDSRKRDLQLEARAHMTVQRWIDEGHLRDRATSPEGLQELHRRFTELLPDDLLVASDPITGRTARVKPGEWRHTDVKVGNHIPISPGAVPRFLARFDAVFSRLGKAEAVLATAAAHHRLLWIHPFTDGNGRVARLMSHAVLLNTLETGALWSVARGLARNVSQYKQHLASCDLPRRSDLDGRGSLSEAALAAFTEFFLKTCIDQVRFMEALVQPERLRARIVDWAASEVRLGTLPPQSGKVLEALLYRGELPRSDVAALLDVTDRHARRIVSALSNRGVLASEGPRDPFRISFPAALATQWMPELFPERLEPLPPRITAPVPLQVLRTDLPRVLELSDAVGDAGTPHAYFRDFEKSLQTRPLKRRAFKVLESTLSTLDAEAWALLKQRAAAKATEPHQNRGRGWQALFDTLNEARGFQHLRSLGCANIRFIECHRDQETPDLEATLGGQRVLCEVKTINISEHEATARLGSTSGAPVVRTVPTTLGPAFMSKLDAALAKGVKQLDSADPTREARRFIFCVLHFDDAIGDYQPSYLREIDIHLEASPVVPAELVFCVPNNLFGWSFSMRMALVVSE